MENTELDLLLSKNRLFFQWSDISRTWSLTHNLKHEGNLTLPTGQAAVNIGAAQTAAIRVLQSMHRLDDANSRESPELEFLLSKHRLTFNWGNPGQRWWLVGQNKGSNTLIRTTARPAKDIETAKADAVQYIMRNF